MRFYLSEIMKVENLTFNSQRLLDYFLNRNKNCRYITGSLIS